MTHALSTSARRLVLCATVAVTAGAQPSPLTFDAAWTWEQGRRSSMRRVLSDSAATEPAIRAAVDTLESLLAWVRQPAVSALVSADKQPLMAWQQTDILADLASAYARLRNWAAVARALRAQETYLSSPESPVGRGASDEGLYSTYADMLRWNPLASAALNDSGVVSAARALRRRDRLRRYADPPFTLSYTDTLPLADRVAGLAYLWSEARYNFANFDLVPDLDWGAEYQAALRAVSQTANTAAYYRELQRFIAKLQDGHTNISLPNAASAGHEIRPRLFPELIEGRVFIRALGNPTLATLGFAPGQEILAIDSIPVLDYGRTRIAPYMAASTPQDRDHRTFTRFLLRGAQGIPARLTIRERNGTIRHLAAPRDTALPWDVVKPIVLTWLPNRVAHIQLNTFADRSVVTEFRKALPELRTAAALVLDLRNNGGGNSGNGYEILSHLVERRSPISQWSTPEYNAAFRSWRRPQKQYAEPADTIIPDSVRLAMPVALVMGPATYSAAEDFAVAFDVARRGPMIGEATGGSTGNPIMLQLPGGGSARICSKRDRYPDGREFVGVGVQPTQVVPRTIADLLRGRDAALEAAVAAVTRRR